MEKIKLFGRFDLPAKFGIGYEEWLIEAVLITDIRRELNAFSVYKNAILN